MTVMIARKRRTLHVARRNNFLNTYNLIYNINNLVGVFFAGNDTPPRTMSRIQASFSIPRSPSIPYVQVLDTELSNKYGGICLSRRYLIDPTELVLQLKKKPDMIRYTTGNTSDEDSDDSEYKYCD